jgi:GntR family transcriptional regulator
MLNIDPTDANPIWKQIEDEVRRLVAAGELRPGELIPSVRDLARQLRVNPATVARAYQHLTDAGTLTVKRGDGTYVADHPPVIGRGERDRLLRDGATRYASTAILAGSDFERASTELSAAFDRIRKSDGGNRR